MNSPNAAEAPSCLPPPLPNGQLYIDRLSPREREILDFVYGGLTNKAIGLKLEISSKTVEKARSNAMQKMGVSCFAGLIRLMCRETETEL